MGKNSYASKRQTVAADFVKLLQQNLKAALVCPEESMSVELPDALRLVGCVHDVNGHVVLHFNKRVDRTTPGQDFQLVLKPVLWSQVTERSKEPDAGTET